MKNVERTFSLLVVKRGIPGRCGLDVGIGRSGMCVDAPAAFMRLGIDSTVFASIFSATPLSSGAMVPDGMAAWNGRKIS